MTGSKKLPGIILIAVLMLTKLTTTAQVGILNDSIPNQLDIFKVNPLLLGLNEARFMYEMELKKTVSAEFGVGILYPNPFWINVSNQQLPTYGDRTYMSSGAGLYLSMRKYIDKKNYFYQPPFRSYVSLTVFYRYSQYSDKWLGFVGADANSSYSLLLSEKIHQTGVIARVGWQKTTGKFVLDFYTGLGVRYKPVYTTLHARNDSITNTDGSFPVNGIIPQTKIIETSEWFKDYSLIINLGLNIGIRRNNRERNYGMIDEEKEFEKQPEF